jgi:hypothetical protein
VATGVSAFSDVPGGPELIKWFGDAPSFHDAEILELSLNRSGTSTLRIHTWRTTGAVNEKGHFVTDKDAIVTFKFQEISALQLDGFSSQNVIFGLHLRRLPATSATSDTEASCYEITLEPCYGLHGVICARQLSIALTPGRPGK